MTTTLTRLISFRAIGLLAVAHLRRQVGLSSNIFKTYSMERGLLPTLPHARSMLARPLNACSLCGHRNHDSSKMFQTSATNHHKNVGRASKFKPKIFPPKAMKKSETIIEVWKNITVAQLAKALNKDIDHVFEVMLYIDNAVYYDTPSSVIHSDRVISEIVKKSGVRCVWISNPTEMQAARANKDAVRRPPADPMSLVDRPPVVTIMGHVDHGKTTLLDSLRNTSIASREFGGITQHIGAFLVSVSSGSTITFLDTPGHAAFMSMRARGAHVTDIVVLVVAADDGVMEQTVECIRLANRANVPIIVAINKIDKPQADIELCKKSLLQHGLQLEETGGDVQAVPISALEGHNLDALMETILMQAELMQLMADPKGLVEGYIVESRSDHTRGKLSTAIIKRGTLNKGACLVAGTAWAKVKGMYDDKGQAMQSASPSTPVEIVGWKDLPSAGDELLEVESEKRAHEVVNYRVQMAKERKMEDDLTAVKAKADEHNKAYRAELARTRALGFIKTKRVGPREKEIKDDGSPRLSLVVKGDVDGSVEAILDVLVSYHSELCPMDVVHFGVGTVTENDVELCEAFDGIIYSFNVGTLPSARILAKSCAVEIKEFNVIYRLVDDIKEEINNRLPALDREEIIGEANVIQEFIINDGGRKIPVAGCCCVSGVLKKSALFRLIRDRKVIHEGTLSSMRHLKDEVESIKKDVECGLRLADDKVQFQPGDRLVCFKRIKVPQKTNWDPGF